MRTFLATVALLTALPALAGEPSSDRGGALVGVKVGGVVPFSRLGVNAAGAIEAGWLLPWMDRRFAAVLEVSYCQPTASGSAGDPRVGGAAYDWKLTQRELVIAPTGLFRLRGFGALTGLSWGDRLVPYAGIGPRIYLLESRVSGSSGGQAMSTTTERATRMGVGAPLGAECALGPGSLTGELLLEWGALDTRAAGSGTSTAGLTLRLGYRMTF